MNGKLYMIPTTLGTETFSGIIPQEVLVLTKNLRCFAVEEIKTVRRYLRKVDPEFPIDDSLFFQVNKYSDSKEMMPVIAQLKKGIDVGVISEAGCPGIADPGAGLAALAHQHCIQVVPLVGPSSILLTLMGSGFNGQEFTFHGYLPKDRNERIRALKNFEHDVEKRGVTHLFMETPYRNNHLLEDLKNELKNETLLCIGANLTTIEEFIQTKKISDWRKESLDLNKKPTIFALGVFINA